MAAPSASAATRARQGADDVPALPSEIKARLAADRLEARLRKENTATYQQTIEAHARALGYSGKVPRLRDSAALGSIRDGARTSARSIVATQQKRRAALVEQTGSKSAARAPFKEWATGQGERIAAFEAGQTAAAAARDFATRNADILRGEEWVEPGDSSGDAPCEDAIAQGRQPLGTIDPPPYHVSCVHSLSVAYDPVDDPSALWVGGGDSEEGSAL